MGPISFRFFVERFPNPPQLVLERYYFSVGLALVIAAFFLFRPWMLSTGEPSPLIFESRFLTADSSLNVSKAASKITSVAPQSLVPEKNFWVRIDAKVSQGTQVLEIRLLRPVQSRFWLFQNKDGQPKLIELVSSTEKGGVTVFLPTSVQKADAISILGEVSGAPSIRPKILEWTKTRYDESKLDFEKAGGELIGAFFILAAFCALVGAINRDPIFVVFAGWLVTSSRVSLVNSGWDHVWLGFAPDSAWAHRILALTLVLHAILTLRLFIDLVAQNLSGLSKKIAKSLELYLVLILVFSQFLSRTSFYPLFWAGAATVLLFIAVKSAVLLKRVPNASYVWYACGWFSTVLGLAGDIYRAASGSAETLLWLNSRVGAITGALLTAIALAERMRSERMGRLKAETNAKIALQRFKENYNSVPVGLATIDMQGDVLHFNPSYQALFSVTQTSVKHSINRHFAPSVFAEIKVRLKTANETSLRVNPKDTGSSDRAFSIQASMRDNLIEASIQEITKEYEAEIRLKRLAHYDTLTDFLNRRGLEKALTEIQPLLDAGTTALSIAYFDLDKFKLINDLYGYQSGDEVIKEMGRRLEAVFRAPNVLARAAGDEFIVLMVGSEGEVAKNLCRHAVMEINERSYQVGGKSFNCHVSAGIATVSKSLSIKETLAFADRACREAKNSQGDERIVLFDPNEESFKRLMGEAKIEAQMGQDLPLDRFFIVAQPIVSLQSPASNFNYEVLVRMRGENNEVLNPGHFLKAIERNGLVSQLDRFVLRSTLQWLDQHPKHVEKLTYASVNLSGGSLNDHRFLEDALAIMQDFKDLAPKICFEITESVALGDIKNTRHFADRVKSMGCMLALDDFGAGYTSFAYMKEFPADVVKIDGAYVKNMRRRSMDYAIVRAVTDLSHEIGMSVVAEWAETPDLISALARMGVDYGQGWALGKPMDMERLLEGNCAADFVAEPELKKLLNNPPKPNFRKPGIFVPGESRDFEGLIIPGVR